MRGRAAVLADFEAIPAESHGGILARPLRSDGPGAGVEFVNHGSIDRFPAVANAQVSGKLLWPRSAVRQYQQRTRRKIPVFVVEPIWLKSTESEATQLSCESGEA
jgi:hypothetical protein